MELTLPCPCCGYRTMQGMPGSCDICPVCWWEDDILQLRWPQLASGANKVSLIEGQRNFEHTGACTELPLGVELADPDDYDREPHWRPIDLGRDTFEPTLCQLAPWPDDRTVLYWWRYRDAAAWRRR
ncbi:CPCC family cysteine-rich protein [Micromonospora sp. KLBMP9576]|uniref:CPCC family cysteine-rich protein n=1 Tax=Micromonospora sp. KLBMP9576 TaxID=3424769 RepID=UPI003D8EE52A